MLDGEGRKLWLATFAINGREFSLALAEAAQLRDRLRGDASGRVRHPATGLAVRLEHLLEDRPERCPPMSLTVGERSALGFTIEKWLFEEGADKVPSRVMGLRYALRDSSSA